MAADKMRRLFLVRSLITPDLIAQTPEGSAANQPAWVIAYFDDQGTGKKYLENQPYQIVKDCANGVFLLRR